ncbi:WxL domain-containing protein [Brochothrix thermosphacta]|mgnify:CR=1 FL=1|uniref:WxL domain-containing protein n=1 Tax=Brochothrix thermosphacta TaxID=2756 RepID=UPI00083FAEB5|nr:WxL domain-containing protein [Brochothrix thermosphacta]ODJ71161.1 hypothetical protein BFR43_04700 [Brochothrix thermosphacta]
MKTKKIITTVTLASMFGMSIPMVTLAAEGNENYPTPTTAVTTNVINFSEDTDPGKPVDPIDPQKPIMPVDPINPGTGNFILTYAPNLDFGTQKPTESSWNAKAIKVQDEEGVKSAAPFASIKDTRGSDRKGWALQASLDGGFTNAEGNELEGAAITFSKFVVATGVNGAPQIPDSAVTLSTTPSDLATADSESGSGNWSVGFGTLDEATDTTNGIQLTVPQTSQKDSGSYSATINWELLSEPTI